MISEEAHFRVQFFDVDSMNVVWHGNYCKYLEEARCKLLDKLGYNYKAMAESGFSFPVVDMRLKYVKPLVFEQSFKVIATLVEWENRLKINYRLEDLVTGEKLTTAYTIQVAVNMHTGLMHFISPSILLQKIEALKA